MLNLPQKTLNHIKKYLQRQQKTVEKDLEAIEKDDPAVTPVLAETMEPGTASWVAEGHEKTQALVRELKKIGSNIKKSLLQIKQGTYGCCEKCGKQIEKERLQALPTATLCLSCSKKSAAK